MGFGLGLNFLDGEGIGGKSKGEDWPKVRPGDKLPATVGETDLELEARFFSPKEPSASDIKRGVTEATCGLGWYGSTTGEIDGHEVSIAVTVQAKGARLTREQVMRIIAKAAEARQAQRK